jgi:hypothetical protein
MFEDTLIPPRGLVCFLRHQFDAVIHIHLVEPAFQQVRLGYPISFYLRPSVAAYGSSPVPDG